MGFLIVFLGAGIGGALRHGVNLAATYLELPLPYGTLPINVLGSCAMGAIAGYFALIGHLPQGWRLFLTTGALGGFTTFSTFSLEALLLYERGNTGAAAAYVFGSVFLAIGGLVAALAIVRYIVRT